MKRLLVLILLVLVFMSCTIMTASAMEETTGNYVIKGEENLTNLYNVIDSYNVSGSEYFLVNSTGYSVLDASDESHIFKERKYHIHGEKSHRSNIEAVNAEKVPDVNIGSGDVNIAIIDTGVNNHEYLDNIVWKEDYTGSGTPDDLNGHGTHVAGIASASYNPGNNMRGVAPNLNIYSLKAFDESGSGGGTAISQAILGAADGPDGKRGTEDDADVISMSFGGAGGPQVSSAVLDVAPETVLVASAGNRDGGPVTYPAASNLVMGISSVGSDLSPSSFSSKGSEVDIAAPGENILSLSKDGSGYVSYDGTSMAAPHASAAAALAIAEDKSRNHLDVRSMMKDSAKDIHSNGPDSATGHGLLQVDKLLSSNFPPEITSISPSVGTLRQRTVTFSFDTYDDSGIVKREYKIERPDNSGSFQTIDSNSFSVNLSDLSGGDNIDVRIRVTDSGGKADSMEKSYNIFEDRKPEVEVSTFSSLGSIFLGEDGHVHFNVKNKDPVRATFEGSIKIEKKTVDNVRLKLMPNEQKDVSKKIKFDSIGRKEIMIDSGGDTYRTEINVKSPLNFEVSSDSSNVLKTEPFNITMEVEQKSSAKVITAISGSISVNGDSRPFSGSVGVRPEIIEEKFVINESGDYTVNVNIDSPDVSDKTKNISVDCYSRREVTRGEEEYECSISRERK